MPLAYEAKGSRDEGTYALWAGFDVVLVGLWVVVSGVRRPGDNDAAR